MSQLSNHVRPRVHLPPSGGKKILGPATSVLLHTFCKRFSKVSRLLTDLFSEISTRGDYPTFMFIKT